ncbi:hypothetical protein N9Z36_05865 [Luminiphilus sp.]|nr:hypothetical protein [Luminiphilus sp.]MDC3316597.1 hypothetical protein [bacterium]MDA8754085.1 hypothetical protein [Luminiphilus sp.]MDA8814412.1 hypothetical protein [Luminiphilus sp.]MDA9836776.1 hypothetical protein [Luminiphilus sp.]
MHKFLFASLLSTTLMGCVIAIDINDREESASTLSKLDKRVVPEVLKIQDNVERTMLDYSPSDELGIYKMVAPIDWTEPVRSIAFDIRGIIISGTLGLEFENETLTFEANDGFFIPRNTKVRIHNAGAEPLHMVEVFTPNYKPSLVIDFEAF